MRQDVIDILSSMKWKFAEYDPGALDELERRIEETARRQDLITYSDLARGVSFTLPTVNYGAPFEIDTSDWSELHRAVIGDFLGYLSYQSYLRYEVFISALVVTKDKRQPGFGFAELMRETKVLARSGNDAAVECWALEVRKVYKAYLQDS